MSPALPSGSDAERLVLDFFDLASAAFPDPREEPDR
jgi:hypothetical protein